MMNPTLMPILNKLRIVLVMYDMFAGRGRVKMTAPMLSCPAPAVAMGASEQLEQVGDVRWSGGATKPIAELRREGALGKSSFD